MFSRPWFFLLRRQVLIHRRLLAFCLTAGAVLLTWQAFLARPPVIASVAAAPAAVPTAPVLPAGYVRLPVRFADGEMASLLHPGQRIQLWVTDPRAAQARVAAEQAEVIEISTTSGENGVTNGRSSRLVVVGVPVTEVKKVTLAGVDGFLTYALAQ